MAPHLLHNGSEPQHIDSLELGVRKVNFASFLHRQDIINTYKEALLHLFVHSSGMIDHLLHTSADLDMEYICDPGEKFPSLVECKF